MGEVDADTPNQLHTSMDVDENLPEKFKDIPIEFRLLQKKYDQQNIFTSVSNDVRLENRLRSHQYKEEHKSDLVRGIFTLMDAEWLSLS